MIRVKIKRIEKVLPLPQYQTSGSVGFDMYSRIDATVLPDEIKILPSNLIIEVPKGHMLVLASRSSLSIKKGLRLSNSIGIIDQDYHGAEDEIGIQVYNFTKDPIEVKRGERITQGLFIPVELAKWEEVEEIKKQSRGGFGSTGT